MSYQCHTCGPEGPSQRPRNFFSICTVSGALAGEGFSAGHGFYEALRSGWTAFLLNHNFASLTFALGAAASFVLVDLKRLGSELFQFQGVPEHRLIFLAAAIAPFAQSIPVSDTRHLWWGIPVALLLWRGPARMPRPERRISTALISSTVFLVLSTSVLSAGANLFLVDRYAYPDGTVAEWMVGRQGNVERFSENARLLSEISDYERTLFVTNEGYLSVIFGTYSAGDEHFSSWGPEGSIEDRIIGESALVLDADAPSPKILDESGWEVEVVGASEEIRIISVRPAPEPIPASAE